MEVAEFELADAGGRERYDRLFEACPDALVQQSSYWAEAIAELGPDRPILLIAREGEHDVAGLPLYLFEGRSGAILTCVPQPGPLGGVFAREGLPSQPLAAAYAALMERADAIARRHACLSLTVISNPFRDDLARYQALLSSCLVFDTFTQYVSLADVVRDGRIQLADYCRRSNLSRNLARAREAGLRFREAAGERELLAWYEVHAARHRELGAEPLRLALFRRLLQVLGPRGKARLFLVQREEETISGGLYVMHRQVLDVYMLSASPLHLELAPNYLNTEQSLLWAAASGMRIYNWQSSPGRASGVYRYKQQWGSHEAAYGFVTRLYQRERVAALGREGVADQYPGHYVVPFAAFEQGLAAGRYRRE